MNRPLTFANNAQMHRAEAVSRLPETYQVIIDLTEKGLGDADIGERLGLDETVIAPLRQVGAAKLDELMAREGDVR